MSDPRAAQVRVPGSCSNLGAGFDCVGFAVDRWLTASVVVAEDAADDDAPPVTVHRSGTLEGLTLAAADDALMTGFRAACAMAGRVVPGHITFTAHSQIPVARGLGSSSAALVAGALLASDAMALGLDRDALAQLCTRLEGHPDNAAPALFGGAVLGVPQEMSGGSRQWTFAPLPVHDTLAFAFSVPPFPIETATARAALPRELPFRVAVSAVGKSAALVHGLATGDAALLRLALDDVLHVPYRRQLIPGMSEVVTAAIDAGAFGATISGSGSTLVAIAPGSSAARVAESMRDRWLALGVQAEAFVQRRPGPGATGRVGETTDG